MTDAHSAHHAEAALAASPPLLWETDLFHACALEAYFAIAIETRRRPDSEATRKRAFGLYEAALRGQRRPILPVDLPTP